MQTRKRMIHNLSKPYTKLTDSVVHVDHYPNDDPALPWRARYFHMGVCYTLKRKTMAEAMRIAVERQPQDVTVSVYIRTNPTRDVGCEHGYTHITVGNGIVYYRDEDGNEHAAGIGDDVFIALSKLIMSVSDCEHFYVVL